MTDRERWTVYPLLFLTLGVALRDKIFDVVNVDNVQCRSLVVADQKGQRLLAVSPDGAPVRCPSLVCNALVVANPNGQREVIVSSNERGGVLQVVGGGSQPDIVVGHTQQLSGLLFVGDKGRVLQGSLALPVRNSRSQDDPEGETDDSAQPEEP